jgi:hypothetical protein
MIVRGVHLSPTGKVTELRVSDLSVANGMGPTWVYTRQP